MPPDPEHADAPGAWRSALALVVAVAVPELVGAVGGLATASSVGTWYAALDKPPFTPPSGVFGPVWITLYAAMGVASWLVWRRGARGDAAARPALVLYGVHLVFNLAWSLLFFGLRSPILGLADILVLLALLAWTALRFGRVSRAAGWLMVPYLLWVAFATVLNASIGWLARG